MFLEVSREIILGAVQQHKVSSDMIQNAITLLPRGFSGSLEKEICGTFELH
jgi:hypothetical protein